MKSRIVFSIHGLLLLALSIVSVSFIEAQDAPDVQKHIYITESMLRKRATATLLPNFPEEVMKKGGTEVFIAKVEISAEGSVVKIKAQPELDRQVKKSLADAISQWRFRMNAPLNYPNGETTLSRLTFQYQVKDGNGFIAMYEPAPDAEMIKKLDYLDSHSEEGEWQTWETIYPLPLKR